MMLFNLVYMYVMCLIHTTNSSDTPVFVFNRGYCAITSDMGSDVIFWTVTSPLECAKMCMSNCTCFLLDETSQEYKCAIIDNHLDIPPIADVHCQNLNARVKVFMNVNSTVKEPQYRCPTDYNFNITVTGQSYCISVKTNVETYTRAQKICQQEGGDLVEAEHMEYFNTIRMTVPGNKIRYFMGGNDLETQGHYVWRSGRTVSNDMFCPYEPNTRDERCICLVKENNCLNDCYCDTKFNFICAIPYP